MKKSIPFTSLEIGEIYTALAKQVEFYEGCFDLKNPSFQKEYPCIYSGYLNTCEAFRKVKTVHFG